MEKEIPQLAGKVWKKEDELKQLKSELAALDLKIQLELAPPTPEVVEKENECKQVKTTSDVPCTGSEPMRTEPAQICSPSGNFTADHIIIERPRFQLKDENRPKRMKL